MADNPNLTVYNNVRFANRIDTPGKWIDKNPVLHMGELAFVGSNGDYYMILGDEHSTPVGEIIGNIEGHLSHVFYPASKTGGGGGGSGYILTPATDSELGGVKIPNERQSGLRITQGGSLYNALITGYNSETQRYEIDKLHVNDLTYTQQSANLSNTGDEIIIRLNAAQPLTGNAGLRFDNIKEGGIDGFLGINGNNQIVIYNNGVPVEGSVVHGNGSGYIFHDDNSPFCEIVEFTPLAIKDSSDTYTYSPAGGVKKGEEPLEAINITPPALKVNGQSTPYDATTRTYNITLDGGLTPETAAKLEQMSNYIDLINTIDSTMIKEVEGGAHIDTKVENQKLTVSHKNVTVKINPKTNSYKVTTGSDTSLVSADVITNIKFDDQGHITEIERTTFTWTI